MSEFPEISPEALQKVESQKTLNNLLEVSQQNRELLGTIAANQEFLIAQSEKKNKWDGIKMWLGILKYVFIVGFFLWSFSQMTAFVENLMGGFMGGGGDASAGGNPFQNMDPATLKSIESLLSNPGFGSFKEYFQ